MLVEKGNDIILDSKRANFPDKSALWRGTYVHNHLKYSSFAKKELRINKFSRIDCIEPKFHMIIELKPNTSWSIARGGKQLKRYYKDFNNNAALVKKYGKVIETFLLKY